MYSVQVPTKSAVYSRVDIAANKIDRYIKTIENERIGKLRIDLSFPNDDHLINQSYYSNPQMD